MKNLIILISILLTILLLGCAEKGVYVGDLKDGNPQKSGRFYEDQTDVTDDHQIHFNYVIAKDTEDREWDINGKMEKIIIEMNKIMLKATASNNEGDGIARKYKLD